MPLMVAFGVTVGEVLIDGLSQGSLAEQDQPVEALRFHGENESFGERIQVGTPSREA